ncbi:MAG: hypothetical protein ACFCD0_28725 [Gemmataceae bacterium]
MRFALFGDHADGLDMARALVESKRHQLVLYSGSVVGLEYLKRWEISVRRVGDMEEALAELGVDAVIVAGGAGDRPNQLRRALQSEKHVVCVHPADHSPLSAYEAAIVLSDTGKAVLPLLSEAFHPGFEKLATFIAADRKKHTPPDVEVFPTIPSLLEMERTSTESTLYNLDVLGHQPGIPGWDVLRVLAGEISEISGFSSYMGIRGEESLLLCGRFERGGLFQYNLLPYQPEASWRITARLRFDQAELLFPQGWPGPASLSWNDENGTRQTEHWESWNPWPRMVEVFEQSLKQHAGTIPDPDKRVSDLAPKVGTLSWEDEIRCLELDDAARRSVERRRSSKLEYQEDNEEASFKGTMTLMGCALIWISILLLILSVWLPNLGLVILPVLGLFLALQFLRWIIPHKPEDLLRDSNPSGPSSSELLPKKQGSMVERQGPERISRQDATEEQHK